MDITSNQIEAIVRQVLGSINTPAPATTSTLPKVAKVAMLVDSFRII